MTVRSKHLKLIGAAGAAALTVGAMAAPALAAGEETASVAYSCGAAAIGTATPSATYAVNEPPASIAAGQTLKLGTTSTFTLDAQTTGLATIGLGWQSFTGTVKTKPTNSHVGQDIKIAKTPLANGTGGTTVASASGKTLVRSTNVGTYTLKLGDIGQVFLQGYDSSDTPSSTVKFPDSDAGFTPCVNDAGKTTLQDATPTDATVKVVKDKTTSAVSAAYSAKKDVAKGTSKVKSKFGIKPTGKVSFTLKKGTKTVAKKSGKLNKKGIASVSFKGVKKSGKYSITAKYAGSSNLKGSSDKDSFKVS